MNQSLKLCFEKAAVPKGLSTKPSHWPTFEDIQDTVGETDVSQVILGETFQEPFYVTLVATEDGVHVFQKSKMGFKKLGKGHEFFPYSQVTGITSRFHFLWRTCLEFSRASNVDKYAYMDESEAAQFVSMVREQIMRITSNQETQARVPSESDSIDKLRRLKELLELGIISQQEFEEKKKILMDKI